MNKPINPPKLLLRFFRWFCHPDYVEDIEGDLLERFEKRSAESGLRRAKWRFTLEIIKLFRPGIIRPMEGAQRINNYGMFKTMFTIAWRNALRQKQFTTLNLLGLAIGISTSLIISLFIFNELTYDTFHEHADRIYRVNQPNIWGDWDEMISATGPNVAVALREDAPEFEQVTRLLYQGAQIARPALQGENKTIFKEPLFYGAEDNFFKVFSFDFIAGDKNTALSEPKSILLTLETAIRYFGENHQPHDIIGKTIEVKTWDGAWETYSVKGILGNIPERSHIQFDVLVSLSSYQEQMNRDGWKWIWTAFSTYGLVQEGTNVDALEARIQEIPPKWAPPTTERIFNQSFKEFTAGHEWRLDLQPLCEVYSAGSPTNQSFGPTGNPLFVKIFGAIGVLVLLLSAINFMNLSTARSSNRAKEVGIRKVLGSQKKSLISQFILESTLFVALGTLLAIIVVFSTLDWFNAFTGKQLDLMMLFSQPIFIVALLLFILFLGFLSGSYPAFYLSSFAPIHVLKGKASQGFKGKFLRNSLVVFQFTISIALIICASFVQKQLTYASRLDLGFNKENIIQLHNIEQFGFETQSIKTRLQAMPAFDHVAKSFGIPPNIWSGDRYKAADGNEQVVQFRNVRIDEDYLDLLGVELLVGRNFDLSHPTDKYKVVINESAARMLGWGDQSNFQNDSPLGKKIALASGDEDEFEVIGVVKDFNINDIKSEILPLIMIHHLNDKVWDYGAGRSFYSMRLNPEYVKNTNDLNQLILSLQDELAQVDPSVPFEYSFMDQEFENTFRFEQKMSQVLNLFTVMALIIGCLGLFGLAAFSAEQRIKELGIRKVLGASLSELIITFSSEFTRLIIISVVIACPLAWMMMDQWLAEFAYRTSLDWWVFLAAIAGTLTIALGIISYQSLRVANLNPTETLKDE